MLQPVTLSKLRTHFKDVYLLKDDQVEIMLQSSSKSMIKVLKDSEEFIERLTKQTSTQDREFDERCRKFFHSLKGLLLNMGEAEWAAYAKGLETEYKSLNRTQLQKIITEIKNGMAEVISYDDGCKSL